MENRKENREVVLRSIAEQICKEKFISIDAVLGILNSRMGDYVSEFLEPLIGEKQLLLIKMEDKKMKLPMYSDDWVILTTKIKILREEIAVSKRYLNTNNAENRWKLKHQKLKSFLHDTFPDSVELKEYYFKEREEKTNHPTRE